MPGALHLINGNASKKPRAQLLDEVVRPDVAIPPCPAHLGKEARAEWKRISKHLEQLGLITQIDRAALAAYCHAWGEFVWASNRIKQLNAEDPTGDNGRIGKTPSGYLQISVHQQVLNRALDHMNKFLAEFGMSPSARSRVTPSDAQGTLPGMDQQKPGGWGAFG
jgi:P27 family predicted phage terminase small subunit